MKHTDWLADAAATCLKHLPWFDAGHVRSTFAPKLAAAERVTARLVGHPLLATMAFSSAAALFGAPGQANYAAANAALDAFAATQAAKGQPIASVQWGAWGAGQGPGIPCHVYSI